MIHYLIDAYNLIHQDKNLKFILENDSNELAAEKLFQLMSGFAINNPKKKFTLIFDGSPFDIHSPFENVYIEGSGKFKADDIIKSYISSAVNPKKYIVITSDREIISFAKQYYSEYYLAEQFILELRMANSQSLEEKELEIFKISQKDDIQPKDLLLKYFNENPLDPETLEEIQVSKKIKKEDLKKDKAEKVKPILYEDKTLSDEDLIKLLDHFS
jgi:predicted RNA-binding protein with PIN domain